MTARTRCWWAKHRECGELLYGSMFALKLEGAVYKSYVRPVILYENEEWCLRESEMRILRRTESSMVRTMCGVQLKDRKRSTDLMLMLGLKETMDQLSLANSVRCYGHGVEERGWSCLEKGIRF